ncbi:MAG: D-alanine--D-alanyl carrier protein ligase [Chroococcidiopsis sp. SAG 2025]|nr:non-ribosomal peptide synthetase [Chroococcidiopsis sp. SAG 2025]MDV2992195.1 D-alanine--D-alanyl carrier protein ligase [Chroococcidiopsis sp. SAG 2025]
MNLHSLLSHLSQQGIKLSTNGDLLEVDAPKGVLTPELRNSLAQYKAEILLLLRQSDVNTSSTDLPTIVPAPDWRYEPFPLTDMQHAFWVGRSGVFELGHVANHGYYEIEAHNLDFERLNWALQQLIDRHDMLRAVVLPDGRQQILKQVPAYQIEVLDLAGQDEAFVKSQLEEIRDRLSHQVLPADKYPLFEFRVTRWDGGRVRLHVSYDLQVFDAWSLFRLFDEWFQLYQNPQIELPPLELSFRDYVLAEQALQKTQLYERSQEYWLNRLDSIPPAPDLPLAQNPSAIKQHRCRRYAGRLERREWQQLKRRAAQAGLTPSGVLLAAFAEILTVWSKNPQFTINLALFNRLPLHPQVNDILGDFSSVTLLTVENSTPEPFTHRAVRLQKQLWQDLEHRYFSGVRVTRELARRKGTAPSAMPVVFTSTLGFGAIGQETLTFSRFGELVYGISQASQAWMDVQVWEEKEILTFNWDVVEELFPEGLIADMFGAYCRLLEQLATSESVWQETSRKLIPPTQLAQRDAINATDAPISNELLHTLFAAQVSARANATAIVSPQRNLTYQELSELSNALGHKLRSLGATPNKLVALVMEKGWEQIVAVMSILAAGAAYVPIDPELPQERLFYLLENSEAEIVLTQSWLNEKLEWLPGLQRLCVDKEELAIAQPLQPIQSPDDLAYVIYTSGSTGLPKGVMVTHRNVVNVVVHTNQRFNVSPQDRILALTALNHDLSVYDIFGLLSAGGTIVIPDASRVKDPSHWNELMAREKVTLWNSVPAMMEMLVDYVEQQSGMLPEGLRLAILGGDWLPVSLPNRLKALAAGVQILSIGGPTETTIWNIGYPIQEVDPEWKSIPYGQPMANSKYYILNEALEDCPIWVPGQMYCAGVQLAKGYWRNEDKTRENFITHPRTGDRLYRTGDLGRYLPNGNIKFLGRLDFQIKLRGYRIEAGEIEAVLIQHPAIRAAAIAKVEQGGNSYLTAHLVPEPDRTSALFELESIDAAHARQVWQSLVTAGGQAPQNFWQADTQDVSDLLQSLGRLHAYSACRAFKYLGVYGSPREKHSVNDLLSRCRIVPRYRRWLYRALKAMVEAGWLQQEDEVFASAAGLPDVNLSELQAECRTKLSQVLLFDEFESNWLDFASENLADVITEKVKAAEIYVGEDIPLIYQKMFPDCNRIVKEVIQELVRMRSPQKPLRILEVGAGLGTTTVHVLPLLPPDTTYVYTDISNYFLQNAKKNFAAYPFVTYDLYDLEKSPQAQGYAPHSFDVVIAASVLHDTRYIDKTLHHLRSLLAPAGLLVAIEQTKFQQFFDLNMGLQQGFDVFEDEVRQVHPLLSGEQWQQMLAKSGFIDSVILTQPGSVSQCLGFEVFVAQSPLSIQQFQSSLLRNYLQQKLPEYMVPAVYTLMDALPLSENGKVDRRALPKQAITLASAYLAPQSEIEQKIATVWQEVLELEKVGVNDNFFDIGGDSLLITKLYSKLQKLLPDEIRSISLIDLFKYSTIATLAKHFNRENKPALQEQDVEIEQELTAGKNRLKRRLQKSIEV